MPSINLETRILRANGFSTAPVNNELMMLNVEQGAYYSLDPIAAEIWELLEEPADVSDLTARLQQRYAVSAEQCQADVLAFLERLYANGMIILENDSSA
jgi:hypothetical protein